MITNLDMLPNNRILIIYRYLCTRVFIEIGTTDLLHSQCLPIACTYKKKLSKWLILEHSFISVLVKLSRLLLNKRNSFKVLSLMIHQLINFVTIHNNEKIFIYWMSSVFVFTLGISLNKNYFNCIWFFCLVLLLQYS